MPEGTSSFIPYTRKLSIKDLDSLTEVIYPSLIQEYIEKLFELRVFYLDGEIFAMAMFTQSNEETKVDFRASGISNATRKVPFELPPTICESIRLFMQKMNLNTGSLDIIYSKSDEYYFLEVNPVGQFGMTSLPCNYNIEKRVAQFLINKDNELQNKMSLLN